jgi:hypothetical protein
MPFTSPNFQHQTYDDSSSHFYYPLKKIYTNPDKNMLEVIEHFTKDIETPNYVRQLRKQNG